MGFLFARGARDAALCALARCYNDEAHTCYKSRDEDHFHIQVLNPIVLAKSTEPSTLRRANEFDSICGERGSLADGSCKKSVRIGDKD
jgi:hypothetical protein